MPSEIQNLESLEIMMMGKFIIMRLRSIYECKAICIISHAYCCHDNLGKQMVTRLLVMYGSYVTCKNIALKI